MNRDSLSALIEQNYQGLLHLLRRKLRDEQLAADVLNSALVTALEHLAAGRIADPSHIAGYVFQVAMNQLRNHRRKFDERGDHRAPAEVLDNIATDSPPPDGVFEAKLASEVRAIIGELSTERDRQVVKRFYLDEEDKETICRDLGLTPLHFDKVVFRARQRMRARLEAKGYRKRDVLRSVVLAAA